MALSNAERQRRYIARLKARAAAAEETDELRRKLADAEARVKQLEQDVAGSRKVAQDAVDSLVRVRKELCWERDKARTYLEDNKRLRSAKDFYERFKVVMSGRALPREAGEKLAKLLPLLGSDNAGEVTATVVAIRRTLNKHGLDFNDWAGRL
jgi:DNA gyrase/topoisomerase IV subunit A